jgi:hypothetical protein
VHLVGFMCFWSVSVLGPFKKSLNRFAESQGRGTPANASVPFNKIRFAFCFQLFGFVFVAKVRRFLDSPTIKLKPVPPNFTASIKCHL